jgi:hypothetical protein
MSSSGFASLLLGCFAEITSQVAHKTHGPFVLCTSRIGNIRSLGSNHLESIDHTLDLFSIVALGYEEVCCKASQTNNLWKHTTGIIGVIGILGIISYSHCVLDTTKQNDKIHKTHGQQIPGRNCSEVAEAPQAG